MYQIIVHECVILEVGCTGYWTFRKARHGRTDLKKKVSWKRPDNDVLKV